MPQAPQQTIIIVKPYSLYNLMSQIASCIGLIILLAAVVQLWQSGQYNNGPIATIVFAIVVLCLCGSLLSL